MSHTALAHNRMPPDHTANRPTASAKTAVLAEAREFLACEELVESVTAGRATAVAEEIRRTGTYVHTGAELIWGARIAWRNAVACLGRPYWRGLDVRDRREAGTPAALAEACVEHLRAATHGGRVRLLLTAGPPVHAGQQGLRILNRQLVGYAGYRQPDGVVGDPQSVQLTELAIALGWRGTGSPFDLLPLVIQPGPGQRPEWFALPQDAVLEVPLSHPDLPWFADLGLRWYAHPAICDQRLRLGGVDYPAAPFSAWYTSGEVAGENLAHRYQVLPLIAHRMGLDTSRTSTLWVDRALLELHAAVLHSYQQHNVVMVDHLHAARAFARFEDREQAAGRPVYARHAALVAPTAAATTEIYYRTYRDTIVLPNFFPPPPLPDGTELLDPNLDLDVGQGDAEGDPR